MFVIYKHRLLFLCIMERVVILARVSTDKQDYERQVNELSDYCRKMDWTIEKVFANKISGAVKIE